MPCPPEHDEQAAVVAWARAMTSRWPELDLLHAIPNGARTGWKQAKKLKREGLARGVPDLCLPVARNGYHGMYVEMKRVRGIGLSPAQRAWYQRLTEQGYFVVTCKGAERAIHWLTRYLSHDP